MPKKQYTKSELILRLYEVAHVLIGKIEDSSNNADLSGMLGEAKHNYIGDDSDTSWLSWDGWWGWLTTLNRGRGEALNQLIESLQSEHSPLLRLQAFRDFIQTGGLKSTSANTLIFKELLQDITTDTLETDEQLVGFVIPALQKEIINEISAKEANYIRLQKEAEQERKQQTERENEIQRCKVGVELTSDQVRAESLALDVNKTSIFYRKKGDIVQFFWVDGTKHHRLIDARLKQFYNLCELADKVSVTDDDRATFELVRQRLVEVIYDVVYGLKEAKAKDAMMTAPVVNKKAAHNLVGSPALQRIAAMLKKKHGAEIADDEKAPEHTPTSTMPEPGKIKDKLTYSPNFFAKLEARFGGGHVSDHHQKGQIKLDDGTDLPKFKIPESVASCFGHQPK